MGISKEITISIEEYKKLITQNNMYNQIKKYIVNSVNNNKIVNAICVIEGKNLWEIINEINKEENENE